MTHTSSIVSRPFAFAVLIAVVLLAVSLPAWAAAFVPTF